MWETTVMHKQVSGWTVNFGPNFPESPFLELKTRKPPPHFGKLEILNDQSLLRNTPPTFRKTSDLGWPKFTPKYPPPPPPISQNFGFGMTKVYSGIPPHFGKLQIWDDQSLLWNTPPPSPHFGKLQIWDDQSLLRNTPPFPPFGKLQIWDGQSLLRNTPPNENCQRVQVRDFQNTESYYMWRLYPNRITTSLCCNHHVYVFTTCRIMSEFIWIWYLCLRLGSFSWFHLALDPGHPVRYSLRCCSWSTSG